MAKAGTGDVLTGILTGLTAGFGTDDWARVVGFGVYVHGRAGEIAAKAKGEVSMFASDLLQYLSEAIQLTIEESNRG
jgi:NAD(P)H-hydrate epimerase